MCDVDQQLRLLESFNLELGRHGRDDLDNEERLSALAEAICFGSRGRTLFADGVILVLKMMMPFGILCSSKIPMNLEEAKASVNIVSYF